MKLSRIELYALRDCSRSQNGLLPDRHRWYGLKYHDAETIRGLYSKGLVDRAFTGSPNDPVYLTGLGKQAVRDNRKARK